VSVSHLRPLLGGVDNSAPSAASAAGGDADSNRQSVSECKVWRNPLNLFRGAEYNRYTWVTGREPLTYYDMNLSAQDHQTFFTCDTDHLRPADAIMQKAWRERNPQARISAAHEALELNECATAYILLAEEEATTIVEAEKLFKQALKAGEGCYRRSQQLQHHGAQYEAQHSKFYRRERSSKEFFGLGILGFFFFVFPLRTLHSVFDIGWNVALEPDYSVLVFLLDSVAELSIFRLRKQNKGCAFILLWQKII
uniref:Suppressor of tumorigenicity 7 protein homolog n=1 Tax=Cyanistes caeruleus TaxID=156563 RepID=A0A8C0UKB9_CYACU